MQVFGALPDGTRRAPSPGAWIRAVQDSPAVGVLRADAHRNLMSVAWVLARHADWSSMTTRPTWAVLMERTGLSRSTVAAWLAWLRRAGLLGTVTPGTTVRYRRGTAAGLIDDGRGNEAAEYVLAVPAEQPPDGTGPIAVTSVTNEADGSVEETRTPSCPLVGDMNLALRGRAREESPEAHDTGHSWCRTATPGRRRDMLTACETAQSADVTLRQISPRHLRSLLRPVFTEGGTLADALYMINHRPDGTPWPYAGTPRYLPGWVRHRLAAWLDEDGRLRDGLVLPSRQIAAAAEQVRTEQEARRIERAERIEQRAQDVAGHASRARTLLANAGTAAAAALARRTIGLTSRSRWLPTPSDGPQAAVETISGQESATEDAAGLSGDLSASAPLADVIPLRRGQESPGEQTTPPARYLAARAAAEAVRFQRNKAT
ncbi:helix-turn-helix transcriptional regulator [Streptosporangium roseum]|uniref:helix-turn-helix transcriptional regulator n=1 Tax=Streptosporangium roseum TaxID=2001 RepID=UPI0004CCD85A|nr:helix-turn-helix transcriptional regulator [Streptosporangium roseum]